MADFQITGYVDSIAQTSNSIFVVVQENRDGFVKSNGKKERECFYLFKIAFKAYFKKFICDHFTRGTLVKIKGEILPYVAKHGDTKQYGVTFVGQTINLAPMPKNKTKNIKLERDDMNGAGAPDYAAYFEDDFDFSNT